MERKEYIITIWKKIIKPILIFVIILYFIKSMYNLLIETGIERHLTIVLLGLILLNIIRYFLSYFYKSLTERIYNIIPENIKFWLQVINKLIIYLSPIIYGMFLYNLWLKDRFLTIMLLVFSLIEEIQDIIKEEKIKKESEVD